MLFGLALRWRGSLKMDLSYDFAGQAALVIAASAGIGLATAKAFAFAGAAVVLADVNEATVETR
jgi:NADP-dependent 3-hydroxy acid dehydrogenase YdfG